MLSSLNKFSSLWIWLTEKQTTWNGRAGSKYKNVLKLKLLRTRPPHDKKHLLFTKLRKSERGSNSITPYFAPIARPLLKCPLFLHQEAQTPLPVWLQRRQNRKCLLLLSWQRRSAGDRWAACWATAWRQCTKTEETNGSRSNVCRLEDCFCLKLLLWSHLHFYSLQSRKDGSSVEGRQTDQSRSRQIIMVEWSI